MLPGEPEQGLAGGLDRLASLSLLVTMMDQSRAGTSSAILDEGDQALTRAGAFLRSHTASAPD